MSDRWNKGDISFMAAKFQVMIWDTLERSKGKAGHLVQILISGLIVLNVLAVVFGTLPSIQSSFGRELEIFEVFSVVIFTLEYLARLISCSADPRYGDFPGGLFRFVRSPMSLIDILAVAPFYLPLAGFDLRALRALRLLRMLWILKLGHYYSSILLIRNVLRSRKDELMMSSVLMGTLLVISSSIMYYCENEAQPELFSSIPATMWWGVTTLTTVGYGDMCPVTVAGKVWASIISVIGIGMFALPAGILGAGFVDEIKNARSGGRICPHCGKNTDNPV